MVCAGVAQRSSHRSSPPVKDTSCPVEDPCTDTGVTFALKRHPAIYVHHAEKKQPSSECTTLSMWNRSAQRCHSAHHTNPDV